VVSPQRIVGCESEAGAVNVLAGFFRKQQQVGGLRRQQFAAERLREKDECVASALDVDSGMCSATAGSNGDGISVALCADLVWRRSFGVVDGSDIGIEVRGRAVPF